MATVQGSIEFRDAVFALEREGCQAYMRMAGRRKGPAYRIMWSSSASPIEVHDLFYEPYPPVNMEDVAQALACHERKGGEVPVLEVLNFTELAG